MNYKRIINLFKNFNLKYICSSQKNNKTLCKVKAMKYSFRNGDSFNTNGSSTIDIIEDGILLE